MLIHHLFLLDICIPLHSIIKKLVTNVLFENKKFIKTSEMSNAPLLKGKPQILKVYPYSNFYHLGSP